MLETKEDLEDLEDEICQGMYGANRENVQNNTTYLDRPFWRGRHCNLLNNDLSFYETAKIVVCLTDETFDEENFGDTNVGILFLSNRDLQLTSFFGLSRKYN